jgi:5'(3')-deoxyribonucleotidase
MLAIIDINSGNLGSLESALKKIDVKYKICKNVQDIGDIKKIILPGVGSFPNFLKNLKVNNFSETEAKAFDMTTILSKHPEILTARVSSLVEKILEQTDLEQRDIEEEDKKESQVVTKLLNDICVIGDERSEIKKFKLLSLGCQRLDLWLSHLGVCYDF